MRGRKRGGGRRETGGEGERAEKNKMRRVEKGGEKMSNWHM